MENYYFNIIDKIKYGMLFVGVLFAAFSCKDFIEEDISEQAVTVIIPQQNSTLSSNNVHFKWEEVEGADKYRLQLVEPSFTNIQTYILDTAIEGLEFYQTLSPGNYEFKMRAENSAYEGPYVGPYSFTVDSVADLDNQVVPLVSPDNMWYTNTVDFTAQWQSVFAAEYYEFQLRSGQDFNASGTILHTEPTIYGLSYTTTGQLLFNEGYYSWGVKAINQQSSSAFNSRVIGVDVELPGVVSPIAPADAALMSNDSVTFQWDPGTDVGIVQSPITYEIYMDEDSGMTTPTILDVGSVSSYLHTGLSAGTYYWQVRSTDEAGNVSSGYSTMRSFEIP